MKISNADKFEEKLRKVESDLHIDPTNRILVSYTRNRFVNINDESFSFFNIIKSFMNEKFSFVASVVCLDKKKFEIQMIFINKKQFN